MTSVKPPALRFSGHRIQDGQAQLFLPGHQDVYQVKANILAANAKQPAKITLEKVNDQFWRSKPQDSIPLGSGYQYDFQLNKKDIIPTELIPAQTLTPFTQQSILSNALKKEKTNYWEFNEPSGAHKGGSYRLTIPGNPALVLEKIVAGKAPIEHPIEKKGDQWHFTPDGQAPANTRYRLRPELDLLEVAPAPFGEGLPVPDPKDKSLPKYEDLGLFNKISPHENASPQKSVVMADIYPDSIVGRSHFNRLEQTERQAKGLPQMEQSEPHVPVLPVRNHFDHLSTHFDAQTNPGLQEMIEHLSGAHVSSILFKPFIGGDNLSSHRYWTTDPYILNTTFKDKVAFRQALSLMLKNGMKIYADGAFVNQGLNGVQVLSNLAHNQRSPYWQWFKNELDATTGAIVYPKHAHEKYVIGVLPTTSDAKGHRQIDFKNFAVRFINDPNQGNYNRKKPTYLELYDPHRENANGTPRSLARPAHALKGSMDSVQKYQFPIDPKELREKRALLHKTPSDHQDKIENFLEWKHFRLDKASQDDSSKKWDGQVDVALMNTKNPEVVNYLEGAVGYWTRMVQNTYTADVARALKHAQASKPAQVDSKHWTEDKWLDAITVHSKAELKNPLKILPQHTSSDTDSIQAEELRKIRANARPDITAEQLGAIFSKRMLDEIPMNVLALPALFKANLTYPGFNKALRDKERSKTSRLIADQILKPLSKLWLVGDLFKGLRNVLFPASFETRLSEKLQKICTQDLSSEAQNKLRYSKIQSLVADKLAERIYLSALTGESLEKIVAWESNPQKLEDALYKNLPEDLLKQDPVTASKMLPRILKKGLDKMSNGYLAKMVEQEVRTLDPELVDMADAILQKREFGLNWRIDAAKDVGDIDAIRNAPATQKAKRFEEEIGFVKQFWTHLGGTIRNTFKKATITAELTDFEKLSGNEQVAKKAMKSLFADNTFTSTPNMNHVYSPVMELINYAQRPDEFGGWQTTPSEFFKKHVAPMSQSVPFPALRQYQNLTSSHDYATSSHAMLINPELFNMDHLKSWGLKDDFDIASAELENKACFKKLHEEFKKKYNLDLGSLTFQLRLWLDRAGDSHIKDKLEEEGYSQLKGYFDKNEKMQNPKQKETNNQPTPHELKAQFVDKLLDIIPKSLMQQMGLTGKPEALQALKQLLQARMSEPSEAKAMRGVIVNAMVDLGNANTQPKFQHLSDEQAKQVLPKLQNRVWDGLDSAIQKWGAHFGYQSLDTALNHVFESMPKDWWKTDAPGILKSDAEAQKFLEEVKFHLYNTANQPVMNKLKQVFSVQNALPGNPSIYLPDLFAQGGSEFVKNIYTQNRGIIRADKLENDPQFAKFYQEVGQLFKSRKDLDVLNNGIVLPVQINDEHGILPIIRDNGKDQAIVLIDAGKPELPNQTERKIGFETEKYATIGGNYQARTIEHFKLDSPYLTAGAQYEDILKPGDRFTLGQNGQLMQTEAQGKPLPKGQNGAVLHIDGTRILKRLPKQANA